MTDFSASDGFYNRLLQRPDGLDLLVQAMTHAQDQESGSDARLKSGDPIWYRQTQRGGYGFQSDVPGYFVAATSRRVIIRALLKDGRETHVTVHPKNVRRRVPDEVGK